MRSTYTFAAVMSMLDALVVVIRVKGSGKAMGQPDLPAAHSWYLREKEVVGATKVAIIVKIKRELSALYEKGRIPVVIEFT